MSGNGTQPPDSNFALVSGGTIAIDESKAVTPFTDSAGTAGTWYKFTYYNPTTTGETALADSRAVQAGVVHYVSLDQVRRAAGITSPNVSDSLIAEFRDAAEKEVNGRLTAVYQFPLPQPTNPIIVEIVKSIAAGLLKYELYQTVSMSTAKEGQDMADKARHGGGSYTSLDELVNRDVVLVDASFAELTIDEGHGFGGWPDETTEYLYSSAGGDHGHHFTIGKTY